LNILNGLPNVALGNAQKDLLGDRLKLRHILIGFVAMR
jgi:hypothetical protein